MKLDEIKPIYPTLTEVFVLSENCLDYKRLFEGKLVSGRFPRNIRIDQATHLHGNGQAHAHVFGRNNDEVGVVNRDGSGSHGTKVKLHDKDADTLRGLGFAIPPDNIVEWTICEDARTLLPG
jgi:hypothetical protein